ncbi:HlyD family secretion protein [Pseudorhodoferax sp.]|uniref:HlyD family secretion protein n=1 Tax=Pseudorhodoferax sp. TaxID=1993553 RepID=UPI0039E26621
MFRPEALRHQQDRLAGEVLLAPLPGQRLLVACAAAAALVLVGFGLWGQYTRKEHVSGYLAPTAGLVKVFTPQAGQVARLQVAEGRAVRRGEVLLVVSSERASDDRRDTQAAVRREMAQRRDSLRRELSKQAEIDALGTAALAQRVRGLEQQQGEARDQVALHMRRIASAERGVRRDAMLVSEKFLSEAALQGRQEALIELQAELASLRRSATALAGDLAAARSELAASSLRRANNAAAIERQISELDQQLTEADVRRSVAVTAPVDGTVTTLLVDAGQQAEPGTPLLSILPAGAELQAQLLVPTRAVGFVRPGQAVALRYQAFPYQRFGHHLGEVLQVGRSVIQPGEASLPLPVTEPVYRVTVRLPAQQVQAYGEGVALRAGMVFDADVWIDRRRILEWLFDPLYSVAGRV